LEFVMESNTAHISGRTDNSQYMKRLIFAGPSGNTSGAVGGGGTTPTSNIGGGLLS